MISCDIGHRNDGGTGTDSIAIDTALATSAGSAAFPDDSGVCSGRIPPLPLPPFARGGGVTSGGQLLPLPLPGGSSHELAELMVEAALLLTRGQVGPGLLEARLGWAELC